MAVGCVVKQRSLRRADPSFRGVLSVVCVASSVNRGNNDLLQLQRVCRRGQTNHEIDRLDRQTDRRTDEWMDG
jgi:hypothetical protein